MQKATNSQPSGAPVVTTMEVVMKGPDVDLKRRAVITAEPGGRRIELHEVDLRGLRSFTLKTKNASVRSIAEKLEEKTGVRYHWSTHRPDAGDENLSFDVTAASWDDVWQKVVADRVIAFPVAPD